MPSDHNDVRMRGFERRASLAEALAWLDGQIAPLPAEEVSLAEAAGRVLAQPVASTIDVPGFDRAMMDGYALRAADTEGASPYNRLPLAMVGEALPGRPWPGRVEPGQAVRIMTGAPLPGGADAVLPAESAELAEQSRQAELTGIPPQAALAPPSAPRHAPLLLALGEVSPGKHVGRRGEDVADGTVVLPAGRRLRPQDVGVLSSIGVARVPVIRQPRVAVVVTGDEVLAAGTPPRGYDIADANGPMLQALVRRDGGLPVAGPIIPDRPEAILAALRRPADLVLVSGGSSVGQEDHVPMLLAEHGELAIHGVAMRPSSPAGLGRLDGRLVVLLPGNPVSCLCAYDFFAGRAIRVLAGRSAQWPYTRVRARLVRKLASMLGRVDYARVRRIERAALPGSAAVSSAGGGEPEMLVEPLSVSGASILSSTTRADGFVIVPADLEGYAAGALVEVFLYDPVP